jgi:hypothetical protein
MMMVSGSRAIWFQAVGVSLVTAYSFFLSRARISKRLRAIIVPLAGVLAVTALFSTLLPEAYRAYESRNETAGTFSSLSTQRIADMILPPSMFEASIGGAGIGAATTGAAAYSTGRRELKAEGDWHRNFIELGLFGGWIFVGLRIMFTLWLVSISVRAARSGDSMALLLATFAALAIFQSQITMHTTYAHLAWFAVGLTMAAARAALAPVGARAVGTRTMPLRRA